MAITKTVEIDGKQVLFKASAAIPRIYRIKFGRDIYKDLAKLEKSVSQNKEGSSEIDIPSLEMFENIAYIMAKHADHQFRIHQRSGWITSIRFPSIRCFQVSLNCGVSI